MAMAALLVLESARGLNAQVHLPPSSPRGPDTAQIKPEKKTAAPRKPCALPGIPAKRLQEIVDASSTLQPPLASDAMIRVATKVASPCSTLATDLLQRAFDQADSVVPQMKYKLASGDGIPTDSRLYFEHQTYELQQDRLSLQSRVVLAVVPLDAKLAIDLFQRIALPRPPSVSCVDAFAPDFSIYYQALGKVLEMRRAQKARSDREAQASFLQLQEAASATTSPVQLAPLIKLLEEANLSPTQLSSLLSTLAAAIESFPVDDNSFNYRGDYSVVRAKTQLLELARKKKLSAGAFMHSFHDYLDRSMNGPHCTGNVPNSLKQLVSLYESFNRRGLASNAEIEPLSLPTSAPPIEPPPNPGEYWQSPKTKELLIDAKHLNFDDNWQPFTDADRQTPEWQDRVRHLLNDMDNWSPMDEPDPAAYLHERCILFYRTLPYLPPGPLYDRITSSWVDTLAASSLQWDNAVEWNLEVSHFLRFSRKDGSTDLIPPAALAALKNSSNSNLHTLGVLTEFLQ
jgi:hypothetical protein